MPSDVDFEVPSERKQGQDAGGNDTDAAGMDRLCRFAGGIAHDFNNLLTVINGYCRLLLAEAPEAGTIAEYAQEICVAGEKAAAIVEMVLAYGGRNAMSKDIFEVNEMLKNMRGFLMLFLSESISLNLRLCNRPCRVSGDRGQLQWALMNLFTNSKEAMPKGGRLDLETRLLEDDAPERLASRPDAAQLEIRVRDTGHGMAKEVLDRIFDPYFSTKHISNKTGQGLSLACTKGIVRQFGGSIVAESAPGAGTLVRIRLPIAESVESQ